MLSSWQLLIWLCCLLCIAHLSCAAEDRKNYNDDDDEYDGHVQSSDDVADYDDLHDDDATWLPRRRARRQHRVPTVVEVPGGVDRATLASRRERTHSRRRKKLEDASRRARGGGSRGWRRRSGASMPETSAPVYTTTVVSTTFDRQTSVTSPSTQSVTSHATDHVAHGSEVTAVTVLTEDRIQGGDVLTMREDSDDDDMMMILMSNNGTTIQLADISHRAVDACRTMQCPRHKVCLLNIQGLPMCRCPSVYHCRGLERRPVCTVDGRTYRNKCFLRVDECAANRRMRVLHRGSCRAGSGTGRRSFDVGPGTPSHRRQRQRQREVEEYVVSADRRSSSDQYQQHRRRRRTRRRRPRHNPITH